MMNEEITPPNFEEICRTYVIDKPVLNPTAEKLSFHQPFIMSIYMQEKGAQLLSLDYIEAVFKKIEEENTKKKAPM